MTTTCTKGAVLVSYDDIYPGRRFSLTVSTKGAGLVSTMHGSIEFAKADFCSFKFALRSVQTLFEA